MANEITQWIALALTFAVLLPFWIGLRRCSIADLQQLRGASERINLWGCLKQPYQNREESLSIQFSVILVAVESIYDGTFVEAQFCRFYCLPLGL